jgi:hypothetical protein
MDPQFPGHRKAVGVDDELAIAIFAFSTRRRAGKPLEAGADPEA